MHVAVLRASGAENLAKIDPLESYEGELLDENQCFEHQMVTISVEEKHQEAQDGESTNTVNDTKVELASAEDALCAREPVVCR